MVLLWLINYKLRIIRSMRYSPSTLLRALVVMALLVTTSLPGLAIADSYSEREVLARLIHELRATEVLIAQAEAQADPDARIHFRYDWLRQDLARIRQGISEHIDAPRAEPRPVPPLRGDYRR